MRQEIFNFENEFRKTIVEDIEKYYAAERDKKERVMSEVECISVMSSILLNCYVDIMLNFINKFGYTPDMLMGTCTYHLRTYLNNVIKNIKHDDRCIDINQELLNKFESMEKDYTLAESKWKN